MYKFAAMVVLVLFTGCLNTGSKSGSAANAVKWMTLAEVESALQKEKRPVLIDLYTDWCGWCKTMDKRTYANANVAAYLQSKFFVVKLDAETRDTIKWNGKSYLFNGENTTNNFAIYLTKGNLSYPTTVIIPANNEDPQAIPGFHPPSEFELIVKYFGEGAYGKIPFEAYQKNFKSSW